MVIFRSTDRGATKLFDKEGFVMQFEPQNNNIVKDSGGNLIRTNKSDDWICVIEDDNVELLDRIKKHPKFNQEITIIESIPTKTGESITKRFEHTFQKSDPIITKAVRLGELKSILIKKDGTYVKNSETSLIEEYENFD